ncbi:MAG: threonine aldolase family protein [Phycisphaerales bacterium]
MNTPKAGTGTVDLRSDTVTRPTPAMMQAMFAAELGDDVLGDDPTVKRLEARVAELLGMEAALFTPSGTMANQLAIRTVCEPGDEILCHRDSHILHYETGGPAALSGCIVTTLDGGDGLPRGVFGGEGVEQSVRPLDQHDPVTRMVVVENTVNRAGGVPWSLEAFADVASAAASRSLHVHVDGARLWNACIACGYAPSEFLAEADSCSVCFSKGLGAPVGSALAGPTAFIARAKRFRKMFGGSMRQVGLLAAGALFAVDHQLDRLVEDHAHAMRLAAALSAMPGVEVEAPPGGVRTNMVFLRVAGDAGDLCARLETRGVRMIPMGRGRLRAVLHLDVDEADVERAIESIGTELG